MWILYGIAIVLGIVGGVIVGDSPLLVVIYCGSLLLPVVMGISYEVNEDACNAVRLSANGVPQLVFKPVKQVFLNRRPLWSAAVLSMTFRWRMAP